MHLLHHLLELPAHRIHRQAHIADFVIALWNHIGPGQIQVADAFQFRLHMSQARRHIAAIPNAHCQSKKDDNRTHKQGVVGTILHMSHHGLRLFQQRLPLRFGQLHTALINRRNHKLIGDLICLDDETVDTTKPYDFVNPQYPWKCTHLEADSFDVVPLLQPIFEDGKLVYNKPSLNEIVDYAEDQMRLLWPEYFRLQRPPVVKVNISKALFELKSSLLLKKVGDSQQGKKRLTEVLYE